MQLPAFSGRKKAINLLPKDSFESSGVGVVLSWALAFGKWAVIITQLVVMSAFLYRFTLDRQVTNLRRQIDQEKAVIASYSKIEADFVLTQKRLQFAKPALAQQKKMSDMIQVLSSVTPPDVWYDRLTVGKNTVELSAYSSSLAGFSRFLSALQKRPEFTTVSVGRIEDGGSVGASLRFDVSLRQGETTK